MKENIRIKIQTFKIKRPKDQRWKTRTGFGLEDTLIKYHNARYYSKIFFYKTKKVIQEDNTESWFVYHPYINGGKRYLVKYEKTN